LQQVHHYNTCQNYFNDSHFISKIINKNIFKQFDFKQFNISKIINKNINTLRKKAAIFCIISSMNLSLFAFRPFVTKYSRNLC